MRTLKVALVTACAVVVGWAFSASAGHTLVESIQATGTQWINTDYVPQSTDRVEIDVSLESQEQQCLFCSRDGSSGKCFSAFYLNNSGWKLRFDYLTTSTAFSGALSTGRYVVTMDGKARNWTVVSESGDETSGTWSSNDANPVSAFSLFCSYAGDLKPNATTLPAAMTNPAKYKLYSFRVYDKDGNLVRQYLPARDDSAAAGTAQYGVYETVYGTFHPGLGSGSFIAGPELGGIRFNSETGKAEYHLSVTYSESNGSVSANGERIASGWERWIAADSQAPVVLTATAADGSRFVGWRGFSADLDLSQPTLTVPPGTPLTLQAGFAQDFPASAYVQRGLIAQWDGIENAGAGQHNASATEWKELKSGVVNFPISSCQVGADSVTVPAGVTPTVSGNPSVFPTSSTDRPATYELYWGTPDVPSGNYGTVVMFISDMSYYYRDNATLSYFTVTLKDGKTHWLRFPYSYQEQAAFNTASFVNPATAKEDVLLYLSGDKRTYSSQQQEVSKTISNRTSLMFNAASYAAIYKSIRIYDRALAEDEVLFNTAIDKVRFAGATVDEAGVRYNKASSKIDVRMTVDYAEAGGAVTANGAAVAAGGAVWHATDAAVTLVATAAEGWRFAGWEGDLCGADGASATLVASAVCPQNLTAVFVRDVSAGLYIQDGLIAHYDAIANAGVVNGVDQHSTTAQTWKNLAADTGDMALPAGAEIGPASIVFGKATGTATGFDSSQWADPVTVQASVRTLEPLGGNEQYCLNLENRTKFGYDGKGENGGRPRGLAIITPQNANWTTSRSYCLHWYGTFNPNADGYAQEWNTITAVSTMDPANGKNPVDSVYFNSDLQAYNGNVWNNGTVSAAPTGKFIVGNTSYLHAFRGIRVYERPLDVRELEYNVALDRVRFDGADPATALPDGWKIENGKTYVRVSVGCTPGLGLFTPEGGTAVLSFEKWVEVGSTVAFLFEPISGSVLTDWSGDQPTAGANEGEYSFTAKYPITSTANLKPSVFDVVELVALARKNNKYRAISASSQGKYGPTAAFDGSTSGNSASVWYSATRETLGEEAFANQWIQHQFTDAFEPGKSIVVVSYGFAGTNNGDSLNNRPRVWELLGSNDGETWTVLDSRTYDWAIATPKFPCKVLKPFRYYRLQMSETKSPTAAEYKINDIYLYGIVTDRADPFAGFALWVGETEGNWSDDASWSTGHAPRAGESVFLLSGNTLTMDASTPRLSEVVIGGTVLLKGWDTVFAADKVVVQNMAKITCDPCTTTTEPSNRVVIACGDLVVEKGGEIDAKAKGYKPYAGPGASSCKSAGASHAGHGGYPYMVANNTAANRTIYGDTEWPESIGSGGSLSYGGGVIRIDATGTVTVDGTVTAAGGNSSDFNVYNSGGNTDGAGAGGSVLITCRDFAGTGGTVSAAGGGGRMMRDSSGNFYHGGISGPGGGGRIAIHKSSANPAAIFGVTFDTAPGTMHGGTWTGSETYFDSTLATEDIRHTDGGPGTLWFSDQTFLKALQGDGSLSGQLRGLPLEVTFDSITLNKGFVRFAAEGSVVNVTGDVTVNGENARLEMGGDVTSERTRNPEYNSGTLPTHLNVGGDLRLVDGGRLDVRSAMTNSVGGADGAYGAFVDVAGTIDVGEGSSVYVWSDVETGCSPLLRAKNIVVAEGAKVSADERGFGAGWCYQQNSQRLYCGYGPGADKLGYAYGARVVAGGGHGGIGGNWSETRGGDANDDRYLPRLPGSGGSCPYRYSYQGGNGGGAISMIATEAIVINGTVTANGETCFGTSTSAGAGGTIFLSAPNVSGSETAVLSARGADVPSDATLQHGAGGGGRIAIWTGLGWQPKLRRSQLTRQEDEPLVSWRGGPVFEGTTDVLGGTSPHAATNSLPAGVKGSVWFVDVSDKYSGLQILVR